MPWACRILRKNCTGCGICADVCGYGALRMDADMAYPVPVEGACSGCMDCARECPFDAIVMVLAEPALRGS